MSKKQYWRGLEELNPTSQYTETVANEFKEDLPFGDVESIAEASTSRRDFLKYLGFSTVAATIAASCEMPVRHAIPYAIKPENVTPGVPLLYASTYIDGGEAVPVLVRTREGRPIKIEGNTDSKLTEGATTARIQASVLNLYDAARLKFPMIDKKESTWEAVDKMVSDALNGMGGAPLYIVTSTINSASTASAVAQFAAKYPNTKHVMYDAISYSGLLDANLACFGKRAIPAYQFDQAKVIVSIGADFLGTWISPEIYTRQYGKTRKISAKNPTMSKHYQLEGMMSLTGSSADERYTCKPSQYGAVAVALFNALNGGSISGVPASMTEALKKIAADLNANKGSALVVCGSNDVNVQTVVNAINNAIGAIGTTVNFGVTNNSKQGSDAEMNAFTAALSAGQVGGVMFFDCNPVYDHVNGKAIADKLASLKLSVSFSERMDETTDKCKIAAPTNHWLESWGDAEPFSGYTSMMQPTISPLFKTRPFAESLLTWSGNMTNQYDFVKAFWISKLGSQEAFDAAIQKGLVEPETMTVSGASFSGNVADATAKIAAIKSSAEGSPELVIYDKVGIGRGASWSNNPWLQEMPDPITKCTWDNYILMSPNRAKKAGAEHTDLNEVDREKKVFTLKANGATVKLPVLVLPGMHDDVIAVAVGYGRAKSVGMAAANTGVNVYPMVGKDAAGNSSYTVSTVEIASTGETYPLAITQTHHSYESKRPIIHEFTLDSFKKNPNELFEERKAELEHYTSPNGIVAHGGEAHGEAHGDAHKAEAHGDAHAAPTKADEDWQEAYRQNGTLYPTYDSLGMKWGMSIDLNSCVGCGSCTIACQAENNVSVVGKNQVLKAHDMHWIRIDRYFAGDPTKPDSIQTLFQPMICQHCDNAPCENVCPVNATNHSSEGMNQMAYNRCIGTRYCANNCPYKVRRFNWRDWNEADCFDGNAYSDGRRDDMNNDITRMVLNPDVTVRSRGVMEKCSFCIQRTQSAKATAKKQGRTMKDGEARTACQQACPTDAIVFGNVNDRESAIFKLRYEEQKERVFHVLEEIHTLPNVNYLSKIRNAEHLQSAHAEEGHAEAKKA
ncbi:MAG: TAT-variant-translocated molybdopterin oxidoreductase [Chitinophagaceae bacterium]|nr:TAT-variant-translocated molybdopterin oxidoreductase [Chitinophagaceae bacterium]